MDNKSKTKDKIANRDILINELKQAGDVMFERLALLAGFGVRTPDGVKEAMGNWARLSEYIEKEQDKK